jgi:hypothetical protein
VSVHRVGGRLDRDALSEEALHLVAGHEIGESELENLCDLAGLRSPCLARLDDPDEREDPVAGYERAHRRQGADELDARRIQADLLVRLA